MVFTKMMGFNEAWNTWGIPYNTQRYSEIEKKNSKKYTFSKKVNKNIEKKSDKYQTFISH